MRVRLRVWVGAGGRFFTFAGDLTNLKPSMDPSRRIEVALLLPARRRWDGVATVCASLQNEKQRTDRSISTDTLRLKNNANVEVPATGVGSGWYHQLAADMRTRLVRYAEV